MDQKIKTTHITLEEDKLNKYITDNFSEDALLEISYNRVFIPGKIINIDYDDELILTLQLQGELLHQTVDINIDEIKAELVELQYTDNNNHIIITVI